MRSHIRKVLIFAIGIALMVFVFRGAELDRVVSAIVSARLDFILLALLLTLAGYIVRAVRWCHLLAPIGIVGIGGALRATMIGFAVTAVFPGRLGEVVRPYVLARRERLITGAVFGTVVVERILDLIAILIIFGLAVVVFEPSFEKTDETILGVINGVAALSACGAICAFGVICAVARHPDYARRIAKMVTSSFSRRASSRIDNWMQDFFEGFSVTRQLKPLAWAMAWSLALWCTIAAGLWLVSVSFGIHMPLVGSGVLLVLVAVGVAVPTPAGIGGYHAAYQFGATKLYGASLEAAVGAGLVTHAISFLPVTVLGLVLLTQEGMRLHSVANMALTKGGSRVPECDVSQQYDSDVNEGGRVR